MDTEVTEGQNIVIDCSASGEPRIWWERAYDKPGDQRSSLLLSSSSLPSTALIMTSSHHSHHQQLLSAINSNTIESGSTGNGVGHYFRTLVSNSHMHTLENGSLMIRDVVEEDSSVYLCQANNGVGSGLSKVITLKVHVPAHFRSKFSAQTVQKGETIEFGCDAFGEAPLLIQLAKDRMQLDMNDAVIIGSSLSISGTNSATTTISEQTLRTDGRYRLIRKPRPDGYSLVVKIVSVDRRDSSLFTCLASNAFGKDEYNFQLIVQGI